MPEYGIFGAKRKLIVQAHPVFHSAAVAPESVHPFCFVCSASNPMGLALHYEPQPDGQVVASFIGHAALEGYPGRLHGGVIASLLDGAMTHCLFVHGIRAVTAELRVRYLDAVAGGERVTVRARLESSRHGLHHLAAELEAAGVIKARATAKFLAANE